MQGAAVKRILVIEDHALNREFISEVLSSLHYAAYFAVDGEHALIAATTEQFDAMLIDINLPDIAGDELLRQLRELPGMEALPSIAMSAELGRERARELHARGFDHCMLKPLDIRRLEQILSGRVKSCSGYPNDVPQSAEQAQPLLDDELALQASGKFDIVRKLRRLFAVELPDEHKSLCAEADARSFAAMRARLHRLLAAAGFCGAVPLSRACRRLIEALDSHESSARFEASWNEFDQVARRTQLALKAILAADSEQG